MCWKTIYKWTRHLAQRVTEGKQLCLTAPFFDGRQCRGRYRTASAVALAYLFASASVPASAMPILATERPAELRVQPRVAERGERD